MATIGQSSVSYNGGHLSESKVIWPEWGKPPAGADRTLWLDAVNEVQRTVGDAEIIEFPPASQHSAVALFALHDRAQKMLTEAQGQSYVNNSSSSDMDPTIPSGFVGSLQDDSPLTRNF